MTHIPALLALTVTSALLGRAAARASIDCSWTKVSSNGQLHVSFLRGDPQGSAAAPRLYHGVWSGERALLGCTWSDDAALIQSYLSACRGRTREFKDRAGKTLDLESLFDADRCVSLASPSFANLPEHTAGRHVRSLGDQGEGERSEVRIHARVKRGFIVPGTLWCGSGNKAPSYADLGFTFSQSTPCNNHNQYQPEIILILLNLSSLSSSSAWSGAGFWVVTLLEGGISGGVILVAGMYVGPEETTGCLLLSRSAAGTADTLSVVVLAVCSHCSDALDCFCRGSEETKEDDQSCSNRRHHGSYIKAAASIDGSVMADGSGNGVFSDTDSCCREHDQCKHTILSFQSDFGVFNSNIFTMSHCDCDNKFRRCLTEANDSIADVVGYTFFNLLKMHCFTFSHRLQCAERNWFGMCKKTQMAVYADVHSPTLYESSESKEGCVNSSCSDVNSTSPARLHETNTSRPHLLSSTAATDTVPAASATPSVTAATDATNSTDAEASASTVRREDLGNVLPSTSLQRSAVTAEDRSCAPYKELDECKNKILPRQRKYGLHNTETGTLFHCNCTARLFHALTQQRQLSKVETLLIGHVSQSCFLPQDCTSSSNCTATVVKAELPRLDPTSVEVAERRHLQAKRRKGRRPGETKAKRKDRTVRLYKLCMRMTRPKQTKKNKKQVQSTEPPRITGTQVN
ncbi:hypothetical protein CCH79_00001227 [Gambusia affinis]|uniref:Phospholipase A2-like central domain-containing protein n=1 Tax=Gambusia affinis TaxID=33528 RepID=A0A315VT94_GAMAF|nr:hypothetical protein CCH79_00001227 [Gambusia affinis]